MTTDTNDSKTNSMSFATTSRMLHHAQSLGDKSNGSSHNSRGGGASNGNQTEHSSSTSTTRSSGDDDCEQFDSSESQQQHHVKSDQEHGPASSMDSMDDPFMLDDDDHNVPSLDGATTIMYARKTGAIATCLPLAPEIADAQDSGGQQEEKMEEQAAGSSTDFSNSIYQHHMDGCPIQRQPLHLENKLNNSDDPSGDAHDCDNNDDEHSNNGDRLQEQDPSNSAASATLTPPSSVATPLDDIFETLRQQQQARELGLPYKFEPQQQPQQPPPRTRPMLDPPGFVAPTTTTQRDTTTTWPNVFSKHQKHYQPRRSAAKSSRYTPRRAVQFSHVHIREYDITIGDNPCCSYGPPISLDWNYNQEVVVDLDTFELHNAHRQCPKTRSMINRSLLLSYNERRAMLWKAGYSLEQIDHVSKEIDKEKWRRSVFGNLEALHRFEEIFWLVVVPFCSRQSRLDIELERLEERVREEQSMHSQTIIPFEMPSPLSRSSLKDMELGNNNGSVIIEGIESIHDSSSSGLRSRNGEGSREGGRFNNDESNGSDTQYEYSVRVDRSQQNKSVEIILCSCQRPHMRAFHASWFSFFMAFFSWFAITPLLVEVKASLDLDKVDIWTSSMFGTAGSILMRILLGPACDKFGARKCMAFILFITAVPTAMTGLVNTSAGLSVLRFFIGLAGGSFVACQYWTSAMFTREVAGTANAMVAGWGNLGGGVTNLVVGSALFPLFRWFFEGNADEDTTAGEMAWRTVFIVPGALTFITALLILFYSDDSPKGSYRELIQNEKKTIINPVDSFKAAAQNMNVWVLAFQYACCFGVEVTMTNASALYFSDKFGQSTVSAAGIASIFGFMNLFARGLGGLGSDLFQHKYGARGRIAWQMLTLLIEGVAIGIFGYAESLAASIVSLVFLSIMVQSAEGSTFGIVPYVDRRFTGSVVGIVGAGGNVGGVVFAVFFREFNYRLAFLLMGGSAFLSSVLSLFINRDTLALTYAAAGLEQQHSQRKGKQQKGKQHTEPTPETTQQDNHDPDTKLAETINPPLVEDNVENGSR